MRMHRCATQALCALAAATATAPVLRAQESLLPTTSWGFAPVVSAWHFSTPLAQSAGKVTDVQQFALPLRARTVIGERWTFDVSGAAASSRVTADQGDSTRTLTLNGITDIKFRMSGAFMADRVLLTAGVNLPTGTTGLNGDQTSVLQIVGAPGLQMPVGGLGLGTGFTLGAVRAVETGPWAFAFGGSVEHRIEYTPIALALADGRSLTKITPGLAGHVTLGADRAFTDSRLALLAVVDAYSKDQIHVTSPSAGSAASEYTLGPQVTGLARYDFASTGWREAASSVTVRYRSAFSDAAGAKVTGSSGTYIEGAVSGIRGGATGRGLVLGIDARYHGGLSFTDALVGAAVRAAGATVGVELPSAQFLTRLALHGQYGQFNTGTMSSNGMGLTFVAAIAARREAR